MRTWAFRRRKSSHRRPIGAEPAADRRRSASRARPRLQALTLLRLAFLGSGRSAAASTSAASLGETQRLQPLGLGPHGLAFRLVLGPHLVALAARLFGSCRTSVSARAPRFIRLAGHRSVLWLQRAVSPSTIDPFRSNSQAKLSRRVVSATSLQAARAPVTMQNATGRGVQPTSDAPRAATSRPGARSAPELTRGTNVLPHWRAIFRAKTLVRSASFDYISRFHIAA